MKVRKGFVSNSSSSSFVCDISGEVEAGYDMCMSDAGMVECVNGHVFYESYMANMEEWQKIKDDFSDGKDLPEGLDEDQLQGYDIPARFCPICSFEIVRDSDVVRHVFKKHGITMDEVKKSIQDEFSSYKEFTESFK